MQMPQEENRKIYPLSFLTRMVSQSLLDLTRQEFWIRAHMIPSQGGLRRGNFYCSLVENDAKGTPIASINGNIWANRFTGIAARLKAAGCEDALKGNNEVLVYGALRYNERYGLSFDIRDVDPSFGEAEIERRRREILEKLKKEGLLERNSMMSLKANPQRIGLITGNQTAAYNDFIKTLWSSDYSFHVYFAPASMQGGYIEQDVLKAFNRLIELEVDIICLVRGGGDPTDLAWFDNEAIARAISGSHIPVWTGIGHEIDRTVPDYVAHTAHKTPTAVAEGLVGILRDLEGGIEEAVERLKAIAARTIMINDKNLERNLQGFKSGLRKHYTLIESRLVNNNLRTEKLFLQVFDRKQNTLSEKGQKLKHLSEVFCMNKERRLSLAEGRFTLERMIRFIENKEAVLKEKGQLVEALSPSGALRRGYTLTWDAAGHLVRSSGQVGAGDIIRTEFHDGSVESHVRQKGAN